MIVLVLVFGSGLGWIARRAKVQRDAVAAAKRVGGSAWYDWQWKSGRLDPHHCGMRPTLETPRKHMMQAELNEILGQYAVPQLSITSWLMTGPVAECFGHVVHISLSPRGSDAELAPIGNLDRLSKTAELT